MNAKKILTSMLCALALNFSIRAAADAQPEEDLDIVTRTDKGSVSTKIVQDNYLEIVGKYKNLPITIHSFLVKDVVYGDKDTNYDEAIKKMAEGRWTLAGYYFKKCM